MFILWRSLARVELGPSTRAPAGSIRGWTGVFRWCLPWYSAVTLACPRTLRLNRGCVVSHEWLQTFPACWKLTDFCTEAVCFDKETTWLYLTKFSTVIIFWRSNYCVLSATSQSAAHTSCVVHCTSQFGNIQPVDTHGCFIILSTVSSCLVLSGTEGFRCPNDSATLPPCWACVLQCHNSLFI